MDAHQPSAVAEASLVTPTCPYCGRAASLMRSSAALHNGRDYGPKWVCLRPTCEAWVGCHPGTDIPLGRLANAELREAKHAAHAAFDRLWQAKMRQGFTRSRARAAGYRWLAGQLGLDRKQCHIGMFDVGLCRRVVEICTPFHRSNAA